MNSNDNHVLLFTDGSVYSLKGSIQFDTNVVGKSLDAEVADHTFASQEYSYISSRLGSENLDIASIDVSRAEKALVSWTEKPHVPGVQPFYKRVNTALKTRPVDESVKASVLYMLLGLELLRKSNPSSGVSVLYSGRSDRSRTYTNAGTVITTSKFLAGSRTLGVAMKFIRSIKDENDPKNLLVILNFGSFSDISKLSRAPGESEELAPIGTHLKCLDVVHYPKLPYELMPFGSGTTVSFDIIVSFLYDERNNNINEEKVLNYLKKSFEGVLDKAYM